MHKTMRTPEYRIGLWREIVQAGRGGQVCDDIVRSRPAPPELLAALVGHGRRRLPITPAEVMVLQRVADGLSNDLIGDELFLSAQTVKTHVRNLMRKLGAANRAQAVAVGFRQGLIQ